MPHGAFQHRSGRVISLGRVMIAAVFLLAIWIDPTQPSRFPLEAYLLLGAFLAAAGGYLAITWSNWWLEARLSPVAHIVDILVFGVLVFLTEGYTSPFFTFFVFILLAAMIKWGWQETALTAAAVILLFFVGGLGALAEDSGDFDITRFLVRGNYLFVLSAVLIWFGVNQIGKAGPFVPIEREGDEDRSELPIRAALKHAQRCIGGGPTVFAWWDKDEPWIETAILKHGEVERKRHSFSAFANLVAPTLTGRTFLFDLRRRRVLLRDGRRYKAVVVTEDPIDSAFADRFLIGEGIAIPVDTDTHGGVIYVADVPGLCSDDLAVGTQIGKAVSAGFEDSAHAALSREAAAARTRLTLARDLHDGVVQLLAGMAFRLEGIRKSVDAGREIAPEIDALQQTLASEQRDLRMFIGELRNPVSVRSGPGLCDSLASLVERQARQWGIDCELVRCPERLDTPGQLDSEIQQLVREGIANAVRHGRARRVSISVDAGEKGLSLIIADDGAGFEMTPGEGEIGPAKPWSLNERVRELNGNLTLFSSPQGSRITISLSFDPEQSPWRT